ncbi:MAG: hypothetical protein HYZ50_10295 [Deltaproteobacteria bacterium]|nr:hypothetical protein [Deltaproteobacteria bacterium]
MGAQLGFLAVEFQVFQAALVGLDTDGAVAVLRITVAFPQVSGFENVAVGVNHTRERHAFCRCHAYSSSMQTKNYKLKASPHNHYRPLLSF